MKDRLPPYAPEAEKAIIGCCLTTPATSIAEAGMAITTADFFYDERCRAVWGIMASMEPREINVVSILPKMSGPQSLSAAFLNECQDYAFSSANLPVWLEEVQGKFILRQIIAFGVRFIQSAYESGDVGATLDAFEAAALKIRPARSEQKDMRALVREAVDVIQFRTENWGAITGLSTGLADLDALTDGLHKGEFIIPAALPSCGKTAISLGMAVHNALNGIPVGIISAEQRPVQLVIRSICSEARVNFKHIGESDCVKITQQIGKLSSAPIYIQQANGFTVGQAQACARRWKQQHGIQLLVADYIQRFQGVGDNRELCVASIGTGFKNLALELEIPVVAPSQLNDDGRLRESRALGQDADSVWTLANDGPWMPQSQPVKLRVEKCRDGETGEVDLMFQKVWTRFESVSRVQPEEYPE